MYEFLRIALLNVFDPVTLIAIATGVTIGIIIGALPGLSATMGVSLLLPITFGMDPSVGIPMLMALYCGAMYGGSISAILIHTPGTPAAAATCLDGYPMARRGEGGIAIGFSLIASFCGGIFSALALLFIAPPLSKISLLFGPPEYFCMGVLGLSLIGTISQKNWVKGLMSGSIGLFIATIGMDLLRGIPRFTFRNLNLLSGVPLVILLIGLFSVSQALIMIEKKITENVQALKISGKILPSISELLKIKKTILRSSILGTIVGAIPGTGGGLATWVGYNEAQRNSKDSHLFGTGIPEVVAASEAANNAVTGGALIPLLTLGIPGSSCTAVVLGGLLVHGLRPGPKFMTEYGDLSFTLIISLFVANIFMLLIGYLFARAGVYITKVKDEVLAPIIIVLSIIGAYAIGNSMFDVQLMLFFGLIGYVMRKFKFPMAPIVLGCILGPIAETGLNQSLLISRGSLSIFMTRPISLILLILSVLSLGSAIYKDIKSK